MGRDGFNRTPFGEEDVTTFMITYEYRCRVCRHQFEKAQQITDDALKECPKCRVCALTRLVSGGSGFLLSGDCWAKDGYTKKDV